GPPALELGGSFQIVRRQPPEHLRDVLAGRQTRLRGARPREIDKAPGPQFGGRRIAVDFAHPRASLGSPHGIPKSPGPNADMRTRSAGPGRVHGAWTYATMSLAAPRDWPAPDSEARVFRGTPGSLFRTGAYRLSDKNAAKQNRVRRCEAR